MVGDPHVIQHEINTINWIYGFMDQLVSMGLPPLMASERPTADSTNSSPLAHLLRPKFAGASAVACARNTTRMLAKGWYWLINANNDIIMVKNDWKMLEIRNYNQQSPTTIIWSRTLNHGWNCFIIVSKKAKWKTTAKQFTGLNRCHRFAGDIPFYVGLVDGNEPCSHKNVT